MKASLIFLIIMAVFSLWYCAGVRITELRKNTPAGPKEPARIQKGFKEDFKQWVINLF